MIFVDTSAWIAIEWSQKGCQEPFVLCRGESREQRGEGGEQKAESRKQQGGSQKAKSEEHRAERLCAENKDQISPNTHMSSNCSASITSPFPIKMARSIVLLSSRTFPGQAYSMSIFSADLENPLMCLLYCCA